MRSRSRPQAFTFDPRKKGLRKLLGDLEADVMEAVWKAGSVTVREVYDSMGRKRELAYTTVMTVMTRLAEKGLLVRAKSDSQALVYTATMSRDEFLRDATGSILKGLMSDFSSPTMSQLAELIGGESEERIEELTKLIDERRRKR